MLDAAGQQLVLDHMRFAENLAKRVWKRWRGLRDEIEGEAYLGLCEAALSYREGRNCTFRTWAHFRIVGRIMDLMRRQLPRGYQRRAGDPDRPWISPIVLSDGEVEEATSAEHDTFSQVDSFEEFASFLDSLQERDSEILRLVFGEGTSQSECGERLGIHESTVSLSIQRSKATLASLLKSKGDDGARTHFEA